jgi:mRNA interferase MazF
MTTEPGQVYLVDLGMAAKTRPMLVVSRRDKDAPRALAVCAPITTSTRGSDYEVSI